MTSKNIISLDISLISFKNAIESIRELAKNKKPSYSCFANVHMLIEAHRNSAFQSKVNQANYVFADGMPVAASLKLLHGIKQDRIAGMDFMPRFLDVCHREKLSVFFFGSSNEILEQLKRKLEMQNMGSVVCGAFSPPYKEFSKEDNTSFHAAINAAKPNLVFVALGCPKQEIWMSENYSFINAPLLGVGGAFSVFAGAITRAPAWMQRLSLEWLYRLWQEPQRMWKRYLVTNTLFLLLITKEFFLIKLKIKK